MIVAIASGKGGTGKTTLAVNLAASLDEEVQLLDCDVEEPNCHLFLGAELDHCTRAGVPVPVVDSKLCTSCGECSDICRFNALAVTKTGVLLFPELCHGCGGCTLVCPEQAISESVRTIGVVAEGRAGSVSLVHGRLDIGEAMAPPLIRAVKARTKLQGTVLVDAPPGTSCSMITTIRGCDVVMLVTEPTPFGLNDLELAVGAVRALAIPFVVVINRDGVGDDRVERYCAQEGISILARIPDDRRIAEAYSRGELVVRALPSTIPLFRDLAARLRAVANGEAASG